MLIPTNTGKGTQPMSEHVLEIKDDQFENDVLKES
jgi:hypothetical protein